MSENLLYILGARNRGGVEKRFINYFIYLSKQKKHDYNYCLVINRSILEKDEKEILDNDVRLRKFYYGRNKHNYKSTIDKKGHHLMLFFKLAQVVVKYQIDIVHFITTTSLNFNFLFKKPNLKVASLYSTGHISETLLIPTIRKTSEYMFHYDCLSENVQKKLIKSLNIKGKYAHVAPGSFIDLKNTEFNFNEKENLIVWAGTLNKQKGVLLLIEFLICLKDNFKDFKLIILGEGPFKEVIQNTVISNNLTKRVSITYTNQPKKYFRKSKIFLSLQENDNYPSQSLLEAMACGNAIIATDEGETFKIVNDSNGIRVKRKASDIVEAFKELINKDLKLMSQNSRSMVLKNHIIDNYHSHLLKIYQQNRKTS